MDYEVFASDGIDNYYFFADREDSARQLYRMAKKSDLYTYVALYNVVHFEELLEDWILEDWSEEE